MYQKIKEEERTTSKTECEIDVSCYPLLPLKLWIYLLLCFPSFLRIALMPSFATDRTRSSFASPMHERETMNPQSGNAYNYNSNPHASMDEYKEPPSGIFRTQTNYTNSSMDEKNRYGADVQSVHSIPPVYAQQGYSRSIHTSPGDLSGATLFPGQNESEDDTHNIDNNHDNHAGNNAPVHQMLANINTSLSSFKPVPPPGSRSAAPPRVEEPSYPPRMQSHGAMTTSNGQDRSQRYKGDSQQQQQRQQQYYAQDQYQPRQRTYSRNEPSQQQQRQPNAYSSRNGPTSPSYSDGTSIASGRSRNGGSTVTKPVVQDYFSSPEGSANRNNAAAAAAVTAGREPLSPTYQSRYRMPPQNRNRAMSPPLPAAAAVAPASHQQTYHNPCAAFAEDNNGNYNSYNAYTDQYPAGRGNNYDQQQQQQRQRQYEQAYQSRQQQQQYQEEYSPPYNSYRQY